MNVYSLDHEKSNRRFNLYVLHYSIAIEWTTYYALLG